MTRWLLLSMVLTVLAFLAVGYLFVIDRDLLLERVPIHWNIDFEPDQFVDRDTALWYFLLYPGVMALVVLLTLVLPWLSPKNFTIDRFRAVFDYVMTLLVIFFGFLLVVQIRASTEAGADPGRWFVAAVFLLFVLLGNVLGKVQRNFWMGIRTPWTLASEPVWIGTHRLAAWLWVAGGLIGFAAVVAGLPFLWCFIGLMVVVLLPIPYSLILYKRLERQGKA